MKYSILINQKAVFDAGLHEKTDLVDWAMLDYIQAWQQSPGAKRVSGFVWLDYKHLIKSMPLLNLSSKSSVSNRISKLSDAGLIGIKRDEMNRVYVKTTALFFNICQFNFRMTESPENERGVPENERGVPENERGVPENERILNNKVNNQDKQPPPQAQAESVKQAASFCGGGVEVDFKKLIFPKSFSELDKTVALKMLEQRGVAVEDWQAVVDTVRAKLEKGGVQSTALEFLGGIIRKYKAGEFDPSAAAAIAQKREAIRKERARLAAQPVEKPHTGEMTAAAALALKALSSKLTGGYATH